MKSSYYKPFKSYQDLTHPMRDSQFDLNMQQDGGFVFSLENNIEVKFYKIELKNNLKNTKPRKKQDDTYVIAKVSQAWQHRGGESESGSKINKSQVNEE